MNLLRHKILFCIVLPLVACAQSPTANKSDTTNTAAENQPSQADQDDMIGIVKTFEEEAKRAAEEAKKRPPPSPEEQAIIDKINAHPDRVHPPIGSYTVIVPAGDPEAKNLSDEVVGERQSGADWPYKAKPQRKYRVFGRIPPHLRIAMASGFDMYKFRTPECQAEMQRRGIRSQWGMMNSPIKVTQTGDRYEAVIVIDRFEDNDPCQWVYQSTEAAIFHKDRPDKQINASLTVDARWYHLPGIRMKRCRRDARACSEERAWIQSNADSKPALILCGTRKWDTGAQYLCNAKNSNVWKETHLLMPSTKSMQVNVYDIDIEPNPLASSSSKPATKE